MSTLAFVKSLYINGYISGGPDAQLDSTNSNRPSFPISFMAGDRFTLAVLFREPDPENGPSFPMTLEEGSTIVIAGKLAAEAGTLLFATSSFGFENDAYKGTIDLNTDAIVAAMAPIANGAYLDIYIDIEVRNSDLSKNMTFRASGKLYKQAYSGETAPGYQDLPAAILTSPDGSRWQLGIDNDGEITKTKVSE